MTEFGAPDPQPEGRLQPPRRRPPTAVGTATQPPPRGRSTDYLTTLDARTIAWLIAVPLLTGTLVFLLAYSAPTLLPPIFAGFVGALLGLGVIYGYRNRLNTLLALAPLAFGGIAAGALILTGATPASVPRTASGWNVAVAVVLGILAALLICVNAMGWLLVWFNRRESHTRHGPPASAGRGA